METPCDNQRPIPCRVRCASCGEWIYITYSDWCDGIDSLCPDCASAINDDSIYNGEVNGDHPY